MASLSFTDGKYFLIPRNTLPADDYSSGGMIATKLVLGKTTEIWEKTTTGGVKFSSNGNRRVVVSKTGFSDWSFQPPYGDYVILTINTTNELGLCAYSKYSGKFRSSGRDYYHWFGVNGNAGTGEYPNLNDFIQAVGTGVGAVSGYINLAPDEVSGVVEWNNLAFSNGYTYMTSFFGNTYDTKIASALNTALQDDITDDPIPPTDPYAPGGTTGTGGGTGDFDGTGDSIGVPSLPTLSAVNAGFITLFNPTLSQLNNLSDYMWSNPLFDLDGWRKIFANPMDAILGLSIVPVAVPDGGTKTVKVGNISTGITMTTAASQYVTVDCGSLNVNEFWGAYLDYDPYTKAELYLPFIGTHPVAVDDIMGKTVNIVYNVDILSGACCAFVKCNESVLYSFVGQCSSSIPITGDNWTNVINGALSIAGAIGSMVATGGATAPIVSGVAANAVNSFKPSIEKSGSLGGTGGLLGVKTPYLILTRPRQATPENQNCFIGYPSFITSNLGDLSGYTVVEEIHLENVPATDGELSEIDNLLKGGVIL